MFRDGFCFLDSVGVRVYGDVEVGFFLFKMLWAFFYIYIFIIIVNVYGIF